MIHFFARGSSTLDRFIETWASELKPHACSGSYHRLLFTRSFARGAYIFADFERLHPWMFAQVKRQALRLKSRGCKVLNDPHRYVSRFQFLRNLSERGINDFGVYRLDELNAPLRFPVFLRNAADHRGAMSGLLRSREELGSLIGSISFRNRLRKRDLMVIEYSSSAGLDGIFRKYSAMKIGDALIPRHVLFSHDWVTKKPDLVSEATAREESEFLETFPHRAQVFEAFRIAGIDYGRIDYGVKNGQIRVWEINTNPVVVPDRANVNPLRLPGQMASARAIADALLSLARTTAG
ncbi:MAG: hypothetical protein ACTHLW_01625 [Verrucomicrobiota bacterium]